MQPKPKRGNTHSLTGKQPAVAPGEALRLGASDGIASRVSCGVLSLWVCGFFGLLWVFGIWDFEFGISCFLDGMEFKLVLEVPMFRSS